MNAEESLAQSNFEELPWQAFLYVSEELTPDEVVDFEERLLSDQTAREAVADAMKMAEGLWMASAMESLQAMPDRSAELISPSNNSGAFSRRFSPWMIWAGSTVVAAGLAFFVGWWFANHQSSSSSPVAPLAENQPQETPLAPQAIDDAEQLVEIWSDSQSLLAELVAGPVVEFPAEHADELAYQEPREPEDESFSWMLAAVSANSPNIPPTTPKVLEN